MSYMSIRNVINFDYIDDYKERCNYDVAKEWAGLLCNTIAESLDAYGLGINAQGRTNVLSWVSSGRNGVEIEAGTYTRYLSDPDKLNAILKEACDNEGRIIDNRKIVEYFANNEGGLLAGDVYPKAPEVEMTIDEFVEHLCANYKTSTEKFMCRVVTE